MNTFRRLRSIELGDGAVIGRFNWFTSQPEIWNRDPGFGHLRLGRESHVTSRHIFDCSGGIFIGDVSIVGGYRTTLLTHEIDVESNEQTFGPISIGDHCLVNTGNRIIKGAVLPSKSVTTASAVILPGLTEPYCLYGGVPAKKLKVLDDTSKFFARDTGYIPA